MPYRSWKWCLTITLAIAPTLTGCGFGTFEWGYVFSAACGHLDLLTETVPIEYGLADPDLSDEDKEKLALIIAARDFAGQQVGLNVASNYQTFVNLHGQSLAWNLSASPKDAITPYAWNLPFVGSIAYLGFFVLDEAVAERDRLVAEGFDTLIYEVDAYSTLGLLPDPVTSALLKRPDYSLPDTVIHELTHATVYSGRDTVFDESVAVFIAQTATLQFLTERYGQDSEIAHRASEHYLDAARFNVFLADLSTELERLYTSDLSRDEKIEAREPIFDAARQRVTNELLPQFLHPEEYEQYTEFNFNNAFLLVNARYNTDLDLFEAVYDRAGRDWPATLSVFSQAAAAEWPFDYLRGYLGE